MRIWRADPENITRAVTDLRAGRLVGLPTETVYGLAGDATNGGAIASIYACKKRPQFNPLISHVADVAMARTLGQFNAVAEKLAHHFWPGPLTLVVPRQPDCAVHQLACAGLLSIALRCPHHQLALRVLHHFGKPLAAPSANPSGRLSPSTACHVATLLPDINVLDGGACSVGLESTIIGCLEEKPVWLRAGGVARHLIEDCLDLAIDDMPPDDPSAENKAGTMLAPGRLVRHYAPRTRLQLNVSAPDADTLLLGFGPDAPAGAAANLSPDGDIVEAAANLFAMLHALDAQAIASGKQLGVMPVPQNGLGEAINDRLQRAANG